MIIRISDSSLTTTLSVGTTVADNYGFYDEYHFGKCYKKVFGCSPKRLK